jgi:hypothetical protein
MYKACGVWFLQSMAEVERKCNSLQTVPCIHIEARMMTEGQIEVLNRSDWYREMKELINDVQRGEQRPI